MLASCKKSFRATFLVVFLLALGVQVYAQSSSNSGSINGTVLDPTGAVVPNATVEIHNPVSHFDRSTTTDKSGNFSLSNIPFNPYHFSVIAAGFAPNAQDVDIRSIVPVSLKINLHVSGSSTTVTVEAGGDLVENDSTFHSDIDKSYFDKLPLESTTSGLSSLVTLSTPGIAADSNGLFHGIGDHASNSFSIDGQPITDQQSKVFSNQLPVDSIESLTVISGAPPAEYGGKTSVVIVAPTRSGQGVTTPHGSVSTSYGTFGTSNVEAELAYGGKNWGNFISVGGLNTGRFLDPPEFVVFHDKGNEENLFDRVDYQFNGTDSIHLNFGYSRSWFQTPNNLDAENATPWSGLFGIEPQMAAAFGAPGIGPDGIRWDQPTRFPKLEHSTLRLRGRMYSIRTPSTRWERSCAATTTTTTAAKIRSRTSGHQVFRDSRLVRTVRSLTRDCGRISPMSRAFTKLRLEPPTNKRFSTRTSPSGSSIPPTTLPASLTFMGRLR